jgi:predicted O-methyltransferase YrrM
MSFGTMYEFTNTWFLDSARENWGALVLPLRPKKILEIGSYEGLSTCVTIQNLSQEPGLEIHCVDSWMGGVEHASQTMALVEKRFDKNVGIAISNAKSDISFVKHKGSSGLILPKLLSQGKQNYFDFVYVDGSHQAPDVLHDAIMAFNLTKIGGVIAFDDYLWSEHSHSEKDLLRSPKLAIDAFTNIFARKLRIMRAPLYQIFVQKITD